MLGSSHLVSGLVHHSFLSGLTWINPTKIPCISLGWTNPHPRAKWDEPPSSWLGFVGLVYPVTRLWDNPVGGLTITRLANQLWSGMILQDILCYLVTLYGIAMAILPEMFPKWDTLLLKMDQQTSGSLVEMFETHRHTETLTHHRVVGGERLPLK
jgi:hypothetical protein